MAEMTEHEIRRTQALARLDQEDPGMEQQLSCLVAAVRMDLDCGRDRMAYIATIACAAADQGIAFTATMLAYAVVRLARQDPTL